VSGQASTTLVILLVLGGLIVGATYLSRFLLRKAVRDVVSLFRRQGATSPATAATLEELGLARSPFDRIFRLRDYRPTALRLLAQANIIRNAEEGRLYLSEDELKRSRVKEFAGIE
jgi:hypothetical protein